ncbi:MAG: aminotransferase class V-fold PLP-dependent enzyme [Coriobacteriia bacterium]|nr:aminotransferase class V-fold PLP-dependent enzyme [Coriobacteriia bacterium]
MYPSKTITFDYAPEEQDFIYLDEAATSWPKPPEVLETVLHSMMRAGTPSRSSHKKALEASRALSSSRRIVAEALGVSEIENLTFQPGCTQALNMLIKGIVKPGTRVLLSPFEHNSVTRPLYRMAREQGVELIKIPINAEGVVKLSALMDLLKEHPGASVVCQHASNVSGAIQPVGDLADLVHKYGARVIVDGAQSAGHIPFDFDMMQVDGWACPGHKGLRGPTGVGIAIMDDSVEVEPLLEGGTGSGSEEATEPLYARPEAYEVGTQNLPAIEGLAKAVSLIAPHIHERRKVEDEYCRLMMSGLQEIDGIHILGPQLGSPRVPVVSFVVEDVSSEYIASILDRNYHVAVRSGLHCAPSAHEVYGSLFTGTVRASFSADTPREWIEDFPGMVKEIVSQKSII